ncbi:MAG: SPOR domain-containing protein [Bacteroidales bacterium]|jgi:nucleoid DNA-binding protein|nr:SPOR domain-containing protein [Bacteroidales bacterium]
MIATYIQELLATNNRVIVPNFGAFLVRATSKSKDAQTLDKKLKDIYFSPFLKFNDELLEKHIMEKEKVTKEKAAEKINEFIESVKKELDNEKPFEIKDFGKFIIDKQGKVQFITIANEKEEESPKEDKKTPATKTEEPKAKKTTAKKAAPAKAEKTAEKAPPQTEPEPGKKETPEKDTLQEYKPEKESPAKPKVQKQEPKTSSYKKQKQPLNKSVVWTVAIGVPVALLIVFALINIDKIESVFQKDKKAPSKAKTEVVGSKKSTPDKTKTTEAKKDQGQEKANEVKTEGKTRTPAEQQPAVDETKPATPAQKKYFIIAGSFKNEKYADRFLEDLKKQGYNAEKIPERNGMHAVSYNSFSDKRKALAEYRYLTQEKGLTAWILYY